MALTTCLCSERGGFSPALLGMSVLVSDQGVRGVHVAAVDTGLGARRGQAAGKPPRGPHRADTTWGILGGWLSASRAHGCLSPAAASCPRTLPRPSPSSCGLAPSSRTLTACGTQSQDSLPTPEERHPRLPLLGSLGPITNLRGAPGEETRSQIFPAKVTFVPGLRTPEPAW